MKRQSLITSNIFPNDTLFFAPPDPLMLDLKGL